MAIMNSREEEIEVNQRYTSDIIRVQKSEDGLTVNLNIIQPMGTFPVPMFMTGDNLVLSRNQWRRLRAAIDEAFEREAPKSITSAEDEPCEPS